MLGVGRAWESEAKHGVARGERVDSPIVGSKVVETKYIQARILDLRGCIYRKDKPALREKANRLTRREVRKIGRK